MLRTWLMRPMIIALLLGVTTTACYQEDEHAASHWQERIIQCEDDELECLASCADIVDQGGPLCYEAYPHEVEAFYVCYDEHVRAYSGCLHSCTNDHASCAYHSRWP